MIAVFLEVEVELGAWRYAEYADGGRAVSGGNMRIRQVR
jgi:hypothetical protein